MIQSAAKISVDETEHGTIISISPILSPWQKTALMIWLVVWVVSGMLAFVGMLKEGSGEQLIYLLVFMVLWGYFLYYAVRSVIWYRTGQEFLRIGDEMFDYKRSWAGYGRAVSYSLTNVKQLGTVNLDSKTFAKTYQDAFWTVGGEKIGFEYLGKKIIFGLRLSDKDSKEIIRRITKAMNEAKRKDS
ncbi:MAG: hypothetical protein R2813_12905 [Flavobacteriales bacterium]